MANQGYDEEIKHPLIAEHAIEALKLIVGKLQLSSTQGASVSLTTSTAAIAAGLRRTLSFQPASQELKEGVEDTRKISAQQDETSISEHRVLSGSEDFASSSFSIKGVF